MSSPLIMQNFMGSPIETIDVPNVITVVFENTTVSGSLHYIFPKRDGENVPFASVWPDVFARVFGDMAGYHESFVGNTSDDWNVSIDLSDDSDSSMIAMVELTLLPQCIKSLPATYVDLYPDEPEVDDSKFVTVVFANEVVSGSIIYTYPLSHTLEEVSDCIFERVYKDMATYHPSCEKYRNKHAWHMEMYGGGSVIQFASLPPFTRCLRGASVCLYPA